MEHAINNDHEVTMLILSDDTGRMESMQVLSNFRNSRNKKIYRKENILKLTI